ncbi:hypothetical protein MASR1M48_17420 [Lactococcus petauri]
MMEKTGKWANYGNMLKKASSEMASKNQKSVGKAAVRLSSYIKKNLTDSGRTAGKPFRPLKPETILAKGSSKPLIDTSDGRNSVKATKIDNWSWLVGITGDAKNNENGASIAYYMAAHEFGFVSKNGIVYEPRPWLMPTVEAKKAELIKEIETEFKGIFEI